MQRTKPLPRAVKLTSYIDGRQNACGRLFAVILARNTRVADGVKPRKIVDLGIVGDQSADLDTVQVTWYIEAPRYARRKAHPPPFFGGNLPGPRTADTPRRAPHETGKRGGKRGFHLCGRRNEEEKRGRFRAIVESTVVGEEPSRHSESD